MNKRQSGLLSQIERDVLNDEVPVASILRKCLVLGGVAGSSRLREWAKNELDGYESIDDLPAYRKLVAPVCIDGTAGYNQIQGQRISPAVLPEGVREHIQEQLPLFTGVGGVEAMIRDTSNTHLHLSLPGGADVVRLMNHELQGQPQNIHSIYWSVPVASLRMLLDQVRTALTTLVAELLAAMPDDQVEPNSDQLGHALKVSLDGSPNSTVHVVTAQASGEAQANVSTEKGRTAGSRSQGGTVGEEPDEPGFWTTSRKIGAGVVGAAAAAASIASVIGAFK